MTYRARLPVLLALLAAGVVSAGERPPTAVPPPGVPGVAELEARHAQIGRVDVHVQNIFDVSDPREDRALYRAADRLHYRTRESTVRNQLLFAPGDELRGRILEETERILRTRRYLSDAWVVPIAYDETANTVDVAVTVRDVWTLNPGLSLGRAGGRNHTKVDLEDANLLGTGGHVSLSRSKDVDRTSTVVSYADTNAFGSWWQLGAEYADNSDGRVRSLSLARPFYALDTRRAFGASASDGTSRVVRWSRGAELDQFEQAERTGQAYYGLSEGLADGVTTRWFAGARYDLSRFSPIAGAPIAYPLPADRRFAYPWIGWQRVDDNWQKGENVDLIGRTEDIYFGKALYGELGASPRSDGLRGAALFLHLTGADAWSFGSHRQLYATAALDGRLDGGVVDNVRLVAGARYFDQVTDSQTFYAALAGTVSHNLDRDAQVLLGGDTGLRGYPLRFQGGTSSALLTLEHRVFTPWFPFRLVRVGAAVFFDAGRTWGRDYAGAEPLGMLKDVGLGLRLGNVRSGLGNVLHIDLSYAIDAPAGTKRLQVTVETKSRF
jgi:hypothetical protein